MRACDAYVLPTRYEGFGLPLLEAMTCRTPIVSTDIPVVREIVAHEVNGLLIPFGDSVALGESILRLVADPVLRQRLADAGEEAMRTRFDGRRLVAQVLGHYEEAIALAQAREGDRG